MVATRQDPVDDEFLFRQGRARGLGEVTFADWRVAFEPFAELPNVMQFREHAEGFTTLLRTAAPDAEQQQDLEFRLVLGQLFTLIVYAQLILEQAELTGLTPTHSIRSSRSLYGISRHGRAAQGISTEAQQQWALASDAQTGHRHRPVRAGVGAGRGFRRLSDEPVTMSRGMGRTWGQERALLWNRVPGCVSPQLGAAQ